MRNRITTCVVMGLIFGSAASDWARADLPDDHFVDYYLRESPEQPGSDIIYIVRLDLSAVSQNGSTVSWEIQTATIVQVGSEGSGDQVWTDDSPAFATSNGYWDITHTNPQEPETAEFSEPPNLTGLALSEDSQVDDLDYDVTGGDCDSQYAEYYGGSVTALTYAFKLAHSQLPEATGDDEPVEVEDGVVDP